MIKKTIAYSFFISLFLVSCTSEKGEYDTRAIDSLDKMSETIGNLSACSYTLNTFVVKSDSTEIHNQHDVYMRGPDKMYINTDGDKGHKGYWYNGTTLSYYSYDKDVYATGDAPGNIIDAIAFLNEKYGIVFPAADFFYPTLTDDIIDNFDKVLFVGDVEVDNIACISIQATNDKKTLQIWIDKETNLPYKMVFASNQKNGKYFEGSFSNWRTNQTLPDILFDFEPSESSTKVDLKTKN